ncbi:MAG: nucleotidyltransferase domain-containing protein, partial [Chloroflexi bacterium]|nr:nucleotidyltransferase domain-containing protein [Chloroflexota bacterium]
MAASASEILKDLTELASDIQRADLVKHLIVYGSLVRGDYWPGRSDVDVYITVEKRYEEELKTRLKGAIFGIEPVFQGLDHFDKQRREVTDIQLRFHGFDTVDHHKCLIGTDPLKDFSVVRGKDLIPMARDRISELLKYSEKGRERPKQATEALKAIALLCSIMQGLKETRNKEELYRR